LADPADLARVTCQPQTDWPAGYPMLSAAITKLSGDFIVTDAIIDAIALALVLLAAGSLIRRFHAAGRSDTAYRWFLAFTAISFAPYVYLTTTDLFSLGLYLTAAVVALRIAERPPALAASAGAGALLWLAAVTRYNYVPCSPASRSPSAWSAYSAGRPPVPVRGRLRRRRSHPEPGTQALAAPERGPAASLRRRGGWYRQPALAGPVRVEGFLLSRSVLSRVKRIIPARLRVCCSPHSPSRCSSWPARRHGPSPASGVRAEATRSRWGSS
jgi:hypothetical protein